jgi:hypothetical protein
MADITTDVPAQTGLAGFEDTDTETTWGGLTTINRALEIAGFPDAQDNPDVSTH